MGKVDAKKEQEIREMLQMVYDALEYKGYDAVEQLWGYLLSEDEKFITFHNDARKKITQYDRDDIGRCLLENYLKK